MARLSILFLGFSLSLAGAPAAPVPPPRKAPPLYFPTSVGAKWVYESEINGEKSELVEVVMEVKEKERAKLVTVGCEIEGEMTPIRIVSATESGLSFIATTSFLQEPYRVLQLPHRAENKWDVVLAFMGNVTPLKGKATAEAPEKLEVPAGMLETIRVTHTLECDFIRYEITTWYAPGVGKVKEIAESSQVKRVEVLKTFTPGKD